VKEREDVEILLVGPEDVVKAELAKYSYPEQRIRVIHASEKIETAEPPVVAIRTKKDSSMVVGLNLVKNKEADAFLSAGNSGALLVGGQLIVGKAKGIKRTPLAPVIPTEKGAALLIDCGANVDARPEHLVQFAKMGSIYMENILHVENPRVAIVNIGAEEEKGNALVKETFPLLKECKDIHFTGSIEAREILHGEADVIVCEAFVGNVILKLIEGVGLTMLSMVKKGLMANLRSKLGALLIKPALKATMKNFDASEYGGAPLLGLKGLVVKCHGNSGKKEILHGIFQCVDFKAQGINEKIGEKFAENTEA
jgi:glycerol-3-phosphate acyltransferase PlsX